MEGKATIRNAALDVLTGLSAPKSWMTGRSLAWRIRKNPRFKDLHRSQLYEVLLAEAALGVGRRKIRNSRLPSARTLEVLWGAVYAGGVRDIEVESPLLHRSWDQIAVDPTLDDEEGEELEEVATCFLSYNLGDASNVESVVQSLEQRGHSVWYARRGIEPGEHINSLVIEALRKAQRHFLYLSDASLQSLWVGKEIIVGQARQLDLAIIVDGSDQRFMEFILGLVMESGDAEAILTERYPGSVSREVVRNFQEILAAQFQDRARPIYVHTLSSAEHGPEHPRLSSVDSVPAPPAA